MASLRLLLGAAGATLLALLLVALTVPQDRTRAAYPGYRGMCSPSDIYDGPFIEYNGAPLGNGDAVTGYTQEWSYQFGTCYDLQGATESDNGWTYQQVAIGAEGWDTCDSVNWYAWIYTSGSQAPASASYAPVYYDTYSNCSQTQHHYYDDFNQGVYDNYWSVQNWSGPH